MVYFFLRSRVLGAPTRVVRRFECPCDFFNKKLQSQGMPWLYFMPPFYCNSSKKNLSYQRGRESHGSAPLQNTVSFFLFKFISVIFSGLFFLAESRYSSPLHYDIGFGGTHKECPYDICIFFLPLIFKINSSLCSVVLVPPLCKCFSKFVHHMHFSLNAFLSSRVAL